MTELHRPRTPPDLPGYSVVRLIGLGGFADVFLYRQHLPARDVAVKVLLEPTLDDEARQRFATEANLMAQLSHHPAIVTVYHAAFADDGRPFLVMEYCSRPGLAERYRSERMSVAESLRIGVRLASAVQTAHEAGILHRDSKPANVLTTDFGWPALTDFGIAATGRQRGGAAVGMSIPWAPPELLGPHPGGDERSDIYSLGATIYSLLAGRSPFEVAGLPNGAGELVSRIERMPLPAIGRPDVPGELAEVLGRAMAKSSARRFDTALAVARSLQQIEAVLGLPATAVDISGRGLTVERRSTSLDAAATRLRPVRDVGPAAGQGRFFGEDATRVRPILDLGGAVEVVEQDGDGTEEPGRQERSTARRVLAAGLAVLAVVLTAVVVAAVLYRPAPGPGGSTATDFPAPPATVDAVVPAPQALAGVRQPDGSVVFTWTNPAPAAGDSYLWGVLSLTGEPSMARVDATRIVVPSGSSGQVCVQVAVVRADGRSSTRPAQGCAP